MFLAIGFLNCKCTFLKSKCGHNICPHYLTGCCGDPEAEVGETPVDSKALYKHCLALTLRAWVCTSEGLQEPSLSETWWACYAHYI